MKRELSQKSATKLIGLAVRTNNKNEMDPQAAKIPGIFVQYFSQNIASQILDRQAPGVLWSVYTEYSEPNINSDYTYFLGEEVALTAKVPEGLSELQIPANKYQKFTTEPGAFPQVVLQAWQEIWQMPAADLGARNFKADFEIYDERSADPQHAVVDIYIGIE